MPRIHPAHSSIGLAACSARRAALVAIGACAFTMAPADEAGQRRIQLTPGGAFKPSDGRKDLPQSGQWLIDGDIAQRVIARFAARLNPAVLDYEHQTLLKEENGQPAPAAGWIKSLEWVDGRGLYGVAELTSRAQQLIDDLEYQYVSPVFTYDPVSGEVLDIRMAAITNDPAIHGMEPLARQAAATFGLTTEDDLNMNPLLKALLAALGLPDATPEADALAALTARLKAAATADGDSIRAALGIGANDDLVAACTSLKQRADTVGNPDPAKYVPASVVEEMKTSLAVLTARQADKEVDELVKAGLADGRLLPAQESWARDLGKVNLVSLTAYLKQAIPIAALSGTQTRGEPRVTQNEHGLTADELAVCSATNTDPKDFIASR